MIAHNGWFGSVMNCYYREFAYLKRRFVRSFGDFVIRDLEMMISFESFSADSIYFIIHVFRDLKWPFHQCEVDISIDMR